MSAAIELQKRWLAYEQRDLSQEMEKKEVRWKELLRAGHDKVTATTRVQLETFCRYRLFLPRGGLEICRAGLETAGFYFEPLDDNKTKVLFPDGWHLLPSDTFKDDSSQAAIAYLVAPNDLRVATVFYQSTITTESALITPLRG